LADVFGKWEEIAMRVKDVDAALKEIEELSALDDEGAHSREDKLMREALQCIASGECVDSVALAKRVREIKFGRWCA
jgi:hypothetical protein